jgi:hypothetical protein
MYIDEGRINLEIFFKHDAVNMTGSLIASFGFVLSIFSPNIPFLIITYGVIGGFGLGMVNKQ